MTDQLLDRIRAALSDDPEKNATALSLALVEQALQIRRDDGTVGTATEVKAFVHELTGGMIDIYAEAGPPEQWAVLRTNRAENPPNCAPNSTKAVRLKRRKSPQDQLANQFGLNGL